MTREQHNDTKQKPLPLWYTRFVFTVDTTVPHDRTIDESVSPWIHLTRIGGVRV